MSHDARYKKINAYAKMLPGGYQGSRRSLHRYLHRHVMLANFIELKEPGLSHTQFRQCFEHVQGIRAIAETRSYISVFPCLFPDEKSIDFLISHKNHISQLQHSLLPINRHLQTAKQVQAMRA